jgi:hypothetical protein
MLPKINVLCRIGSPMSFDELSAISKSMVSLICMKGFDFDHSHVDIRPLIFPCLEKVKVLSENDSDLQFIATILKNSIPQWRGFLKSLVLRNSSSSRSVNSPVDNAQLITL